MLNIFYNPIYIKQKKVFLTKQFKHSIFSNYLIDFCYIFNLSINENFIQSGPHKRMNNLIKTFKEDKEASIQMDEVDYFAAKYSSKSSNIKTIFLNSL